MNKILILFLIIWSVSFSSFKIYGNEKPPIKASLVVKKSVDFTITGDGSSPEWKKTEWIPLIKLDTGGEEDKTQFKIVYSSKGIYLLFEGKVEVSGTSEFLASDAKAREIYLGERFTLA